MTDASGTTFYEYDEFNRLAGVQFPDINPVYYEYDKSGNRTKIIYPNGDEVSCRYDGDNRLAGVRDNAETTT